MGGVEKGVERFSFRVLPSVAQRDVCMKVRGVKTAPLTQCLPPPPPPSATAERVLPSSLHGCFTGDGRGSGLGSLLVR